MQAIKCELCGSNEFTKVDGLFQCNHCHTKYTLEEAKKLMVSGTVEVTKGEAEKERLLKIAETFWTLERKDKAKEIFLQITNEFPDDYRGWMGLLKCQCCGGLLTSKDNVDIKSIISIYQEWFSEVCYAATVIQKLNSSLEQEIVMQINIFFEKILEIPKNKCAYIEIFKYSFDQLGELRKYFFDRYQKVLAFDKIRNDFESYFDLKSQIFHNIAQKSKIICSNFHDEMNANYNASIICPYYYENYIVFKITYYEIVCFETTQNLESAIHEEQQKIIVKRKNKNVCLYCGNTFKGIFKKVCSKCGKPKDY